MPASAVLADVDDDPSPLFASLTELRRPDPQFLRVQRAHDALRLYQAMCRLAMENSSADVCVRYLTTSRIDLPELTTFETTWGLRFPVPPRATGTPVRLMCAPITHPVRIVSEASGCVVIDIWRSFGLAALEYVAGILDNYQDHRDDVLPPLWSLERIDDAVREQFPSSLSETNEVLAHQDWLAREAGYPSSAHVRRQGQRVSAGHSNVEKARLRLAEADAAMTLLRKIGIPPRCASKGRGTGHVDIDARTVDRLRVTLVHPESIDFKRLAATLKPYLPKSRLRVRVSDKGAHDRIFQVHDLARQGRTAPQIAQAMHLDDAEDRGRERVAELKKAYVDLVGRLSLPTLAGE
jgi:hypothetical protein